MTMNIPIDFINYILSAKVNMIQGFYMSLIYNATKYRSVLFLIENLFQRLLLTLNRK